MILLRRFMLLLIQSKSKEQIMNKLHMLTNIPQDTIEFNNRIVLLTKNISNKM